MRIAPDYFPRFRCIADCCRHSCCIGWEIDIDPETRAAYRTVTGPFASRLNDAIQDGEETSSFRLDANGRCLMLNKNGLCDLICSLGEGMLCQICADHPRFRNFFTGREEIGLGFCCEAAVHLALSQPSPMALVPLEEDPSPAALDEDEQFLLQEREILFRLLQDRTLPLETRLENILEEMDFSIPRADWEAVYRQMERLDPAWEPLLDRLKGADLSLPSPVPEAFQIPLEQFAAYLLFRHLPAALSDGDLQGRSAFCVLSVRAVTQIFKMEETHSLETLSEIVRMYSAEIEYSLENTEALLDALYE